MLGIDYLSSVGHHTVFIFCVSDGQSIDSIPSSMCDHGHRAFSEVVRFTYCRLQKTRSAQSLPLVEKWEDFMLLNHSRFPPIEEKKLLAGSRIASALEKVGCVYLHNDFRKDARKYLEELARTVLSTVEARLDIGQGLSCFCPKIVFGGCLCPFHSFGQLLDSFMEMKEEVKKRKSVD